MLRFKRYSYLYPLIKFVKPYINRVRTLCEFIHIYFVVPVFFFLPLSLDYNREA